MARFNQASADLEQAGLTEIAEHAAHWQRAGGDLVATFDVTWYLGLVNLAYEERSQLRLFDRVKQEALAADFRCDCLSHLSAAESLAPATVNNHLASLSTFTTGALH